MLTPPVLYVPAAPCPGCQGVGLCHGTSGSAYALLAMYRATGDAVYLHRAQRFALFAARSWRQMYGTPDHPLSLYEGEWHL